MTHSGQRASSLTLSDLDRYEVSEDDILNAISAGSLPPTYTVERALRARGSTQTQARRKIREARRRGDPLGMTDVEKCLASFLALGIVVTGFVAGSTLI
ncbi:hypothetical protein CKO28_01365 [Rhodovibrio sodomensis]|uniref:Uncharacterized protein n=1 Tax=Rhodovibrio sodomensis TaxID=1088 RepID=A0ABS1DAS0_9PROT|nr:hypothetical protein [Rhodovibrio sodomensis]MBK1666693.1 hypothetical protein [Rhodovibrio sodomensis]